MGFGPKILSLRFRLRPWDPANAGAHTYGISIFTVDVLSAFCEASYRLASGALKSRV